MRTRIEGRIEIDSASWLLGEMDHDAPVFGSEFCAPIVLTEGPI